MSNVMVYVMLLDHLTGFSSTLNDTVLKNTVIFDNLPRSIRPCNPVTTNHILNVVTNELELDVAPALMTNSDNAVSVIEDSRESFYKTIIEDLPDMERNHDFYEKAIDTFDFNSKQVEQQHSHEYNFTIPNVTQMPNLAPFLVAIFETVSNVTAQTCAGTLISPRWVLTTASCVNVLSKLYTDDKNMTHATSETLYTIVAGALNPLSDGSTHNVTSMLLPRNISTHNNSSRHRKSINVEMQGPLLAMMKIEPEFEGGGISLFEEKVTKGKVTVYGWTLAKNDTGLDMMKIVKLSAQILSEAECQATYSLFNNDIICLLNNDKFRNITQLSSGGPVLLHQGDEIKLLAVMQTDENMLLAYPLSMHIDWIKGLLNT